MSVTQPLGTPQHYAINAQFQGSGSVSCQIKADNVTIGIGIGRLQHCRLRDRPEHHIRKLGEHQRHMTLSGFPPRRAGRGPGAATRGRAGHAALRLAGAFVYGISWGRAAGKGVPGCRCAIGGT
jgi:hypothetical protein